MKNKKKILGRLLLIISMVIVTIAAVNAIQREQRENKYERAIRYMWLGSDDKYEDNLKYEADLFAEVGMDYKDAAAYYRLTKAMGHYNYGNTEKAAYELSLLPEFKYIDEDEKFKIGLFKRKVEEEEKTRLKLKEFHERVRENGSTMDYPEPTPEPLPPVPYLGMNESEIGETALGKPSEELRHNTAMIDGKVHKANLYDFKEGDRVIFTARCLQGKVVNVWDKRNDPTPEPISPSENKKFYSEEDEEDEDEDDYEDDYDVNDYDDPEDFYYDYSYDFEDYEEAYDYFMEYHD